MSRTASLTVMLPDCTLVNEPDLLRATVKSWQIARFLAIYRVDRVLLYPSRRRGDCKKEAQVLLTLLQYFRVPPYLKKKVFPKKEELRFVGLAPPLQIPLHTVSSKPTVGEVREALVVRVGRNKIVLDAGLPCLVEAEPRSGVRKGDLVLIKIESTDPLRARILSENEAEGIYRGYSTGRVDSLCVFLDENRDKAYIIGTSRSGRPAWRAVGSIVKGLLENKYVIIVFGEPYRGLYEIMQELGRDPEEVFDDILNFVPQQGTKTVRIEEALAATLSTIRFLEAQYTAI